MNTDQQKIIYYVLGALLVLFGICIGLFGRKFYSVFVFIIGFFTAQILILWLYYTHVLTSNTPVWLLASVVALSALLSGVIGMLGVSFIKAGASILSGLGAFIFCYILVLALPIFKHTYLYPFFIALLSLPGFVAGFVLFNQGVIVATSIIGSFCMARGVSFFTGHFPSEIATYQTFSRDGQIQVDPVYFYFLGSIFAISPIMSFY